MVMVTGSATIGKFIKRTNTSHGCHVFLSVKSENFSFGKIVNVWFNLNIFFRDAKKCQSLIECGGFDVGNTLTFTGLPYNINLSYFGGAGVYVMGDTDLSVSSHYYPGVFLDGDFCLNNDARIKDSKKGCYINFSSNFDVVIAGKKQNVHWKFCVFVDKNDPDFNKIRNEPPKKGQLLHGLHGVLYPIIPKSNNRRYNNQNPQNKKKSELGSYVTKGFVGQKAVSQAKAKKNNINPNSLEMIDQLYREIKETKNHA